MSHEFPALVEFDELVLGLEGNTGAVNLVQLLEELLVFEFG